MSASDTGVTEVPSAETPPGLGGTRSSTALQPTKLLLGVLGLAVTIYLVVEASVALSVYNADIPKLVQMVGATVGGVLGAYGVFYFLNMAVEALPRRLSLAVIPYAFILPAFAVLGLFLIYPTIQTIVFSFANSDSTAWVGLQNYEDMLGNSDFQATLINNLLWIAIVPALTVLIGLVIATLADKLSATGEKLAKTLIFMPMAISFVGAGTIWKFIYDSKPEGETQIGLLNAIVSKLGHAPVPWLQQSQFNFNDMLLMVILVWLQTGFAMVLLSSAIKAVPNETLEAARIDGASEFQIFMKVIVPQIRGTLITVFITVLIMVLKVFDVVYVMTGGNFKTSVIGLDFFNQLFLANDSGRAATIVVILLVAVMPVLIYQVYHFRQEEKAR
jgi:alpha-glucoside transport system permease protein